LWWFIVYYTTKTDSSHNDDDDGDANDNNNYNNNNMTISIIWFQCVKYNNNKNSKSYGEFKSNIMTQTHYTRVYNR